MSLKFSEWLTKQLAEKELSQAEFARKAGLSRQVIHYYLSSKTIQPDADSLKKIADALELPIEQVYRAAGMPVSATKHSKKVDEIIHQIEGLSEDDQERVLALIEALKRFRRK